MITKLKSWLEDNLNSRPDDENELQLDLATAVLYCEVIRADHDLDEQEQALMQSMLMSQFQLCESQAKELIHSSGDEAKHAADLVSFTRLVNARCEAEQKNLILENLWQLAYADDHLDPHEEHIIRRIADLLYLPHSQFIQAKLRAQQANDEKG
ncbi:tellurite resistance TerB family protein [Lacimicrobium alkaliphilum]|uniref:Tellurium resistance terB-like protein subgroup 2 n=1 Tax=Lacimicrobium alkaliphilum TaxID=1526571 RepID=A0ABQ1RER6_9ALTE|nr:TerB family tellurite resistance protein [Lacimicrobium alkaliphilum]GGD67966.1 tellurium resistance terB-like protein subgroup 2 [Lacimicrobium alkaliphilum]